MVSHADEATRWLAGKQREMEDALAPLVEINSFTENPEGGRKTGTLLRELLGLPGVECVARASERFADHLVFRTRPQQPNKGAVALVGHLDTVFPAGHLRGVPARRGAAPRPGRARHERRAGRHRLRAQGARNDGRARRRGPRAGGRRERRGGGLAGGGRGHRRRGHGLRLGARLRGRAGRGLHHHAPQGRRVRDRHRPRSGRARRQRPQGGRQRDLGGRALRRRRAGD